MSKSSDKAKNPIGSPADGGYLDRPGRDWMTFGLSFLFHLILLIAILLLGTTLGGSSVKSEPERIAGIVLTVRESDSETEYLDPSDIQPVEDSADAVTATTQQNFAADAPPSMSDTSASPKISLPGFEFNQSNDAMQMAADQNDGQSQQPYRLTEADKKLIAADQAYFDSLKPAGPETSISVFGGGRMQGRSFVFLLDRSKSMGSGGLGVLSIAGKELATAVANLKPHHTFQILGYNSRTAPMKVPRLLPATDEHKLAVPKFIQDMVAFGKTEHEFALMSAISYRPDVIVLLSDGDDFGGMTDGKLKKIRQTTRGAVQIHCVQFGLGPAKAVTNFMQKLAQQNGGSFRYVDVNEW
jgi:hypothetical protein